jgi:hypothetical protein
MNWSKESRRFGIWVSTRKPRCLVIRINYRMWFYGQLNGLTYIRDYRRAP